jgi:hypothetical protein
VYFHLKIIGFAIFAAACGARMAAPVVETAQAREVAAHPILWASRDRAAPIVSPSVHHLQVVITRGWAAEDHYVWLISGGRELLAVYRADPREVGEVLGDISHRVYPTVGNPLDKYSISILGSYKQPPPPPPPDPGGIPELIVREVMTVAAGMERESAHLDGRAVGAGI